ncbi:nitroreductase family protein [Candidatus Phytoplasma australiense]|uniref:Putative NAD(P)H nitroreductase 12C n=1 Tax=Strawberry lethal yellows phytoplasma (CPA) str. NZSb11 TaxID=980422 RepID=R4S0C3_PHYAS|nr:nitroreductase family protein [Candidatus Phytoplasma australiense]AGL90208.1 Putative NAD(P)H nitroreductase 12C [Strawberry lethal yellows phytoplasma (CPA) str. NZSb11]
MNNILTSRKAVKVFKKNHIIPQNILDQILTDTMKSPSTFNLQPWHFFVINSVSSKDKLKSCLYGNKSQLETSSAIILVSGNIQKNDTKEEILRESFAFHKTPKLIQQQLLSKIDLLYQKKPYEEIKNEIFLECGLVSLQLMLVAKTYGYDTCPIGGFNDKIINQIFNIDKKFIPILLIALGKSSEETLLQSPSFRLSFDKVTTYL